MVFSSRFLRMCVYNMIRTKWCNKWIDHSKNCTFFKRANRRRSFVIQHSSRCVQISSSKNKRLDCNLTRRCRKLSPVRDKFTELWHVIRNFVSLFLFCTHDECGESISLSLSLSLGHKLLIIIIICGNCQSTFFHYKLPEPMSPLLQSLVPLFKLIAVQDSWTKRDFQKASKYWWTKSLFCFAHFCNDPWKIHDFLFFFLLIEHKSLKSISLVNKPKIKNFPVVNIPHHILTKKKISQRIYFPVVKIFN